MSTGLLDENQYFDLVRGDLEDALGATATLMQRSQSTAYRRPDPRTVRVRIPGGTHVVDLSRRAPVFSGDEARLVSAYAEALEGFGEVPRVFATTASEDVLTRAIAVRCSKGEQQAKTVETVVQAIVRYATTTYEGARVAVNVCLDLNLSETGIALPAFLQEPWAPILGSGLNSALLLGSDGTALRVIDVTAVNTATVLAPETFASLARWTKPTGRVALSITRSGEIYLFDGGELLLARRNSRWRAFPLGPLLRSGWFGTTKWKLSPGVKRTLLTSLIDASAAHHGACLGIVHNTQSAQAVGNLVDPADRWGSSGNQRRAMFSQRSFLSLSRRHRLELLSMDGATVINQKGLILAAGAILKVEGGSPGGGRTAAARAIARYGVGIKVSQDGPVRAYVRVNRKIFEHFTMG
jgi:hypothetical protein